MTHTDETPRRSPSPCCNGCPGWAVFDEDTDPNIQQCDDCWYDQDDAPGHGYYQAHPVCVAELEAAITRVRASVDATPTTHWGYGSGMPGCLFDNGPHFCETQEDAIEGALAPFHGTGNESDLSDAELEDARIDLRGGGSHYFPYNRRAELGATLVEVWEENGECPDSDES